MAKSYDNISGCEFNYPSPSVKNSPSSEISFAQPHAGGNGDPIKGPGVDNFTPVSSASDSPVRGDGYGDSEYVGRGSGSRSQVSYGK